MLDPESPIIQFYPENFDVDLKGNNKIWQGVFLLPFVDEQRLQKAIGPLLDDLTEDEKQRNTFGENQYFVSRHHQGYDFLKSAAEVASHGNASHTFIPERKHYNMKDFSHFKGLPGKVFLSRHCVEAGCTLETPVQGLEPIFDCHVVCLSYQNSQPNDEPCMDQVIQRAAPCKKQERNRALHPVLSTLASINM